MHENADTTETAAPALPRVPLDAYPRLCGLPVTIERLVPTTSVSAPAERVTPGRRGAGARRPVARTAVVILVVAATVLAVASEARAQPPLPGVQAGAA
jgi:hypothetical protein